MKRLCEVFASSRKEEMYLFVDKAQGLADVPEALLARFGEPRSCMVITLEPDKKLGRADASEVLAAIEEQGVYLQMPPTVAELLQRDGN